MELDICIYGAAKIYASKKSRVKEISENCQIWSTRWQQGAFNSIPAFIERELAKK